MKNKTIALIGIGSYLLSVVSSATDLQGNFVSPIILIAIAGIATIVFVVMAAIRLWKEARYISIMLVSSEIILIFLTVIQEVALPKYGSPIIILLNLTKVINLVVFIWAIITLFRSNSLRITNQRDIAEKLYKDDPDLAVRIAMGEEKAQTSILSAAVYAKVCEEAEKSDDIETSMRLANSYHNSKLSAEAKKLKLRDPYSAIEKMKEVVNARRDAFERTLPEGKTIEDAVNEEVEKIKKEVGETKLSKKDMEEVMDDFVNSISRNEK